MRTTCLALIPLLLAAAPAAAASPCDRLAVVARALPASAWGKGEAALQPALSLQKSRPATGALAEAAKDPAVKTALDAGSYAVFGEQMPGSDLMMAETIQGTADCQNLVLFRRREGRIVRIASPIGEGNRGLCWTQSADFGDVFGRPALVVHGTLNDHTFDEEIEIVPWTGSGWAARCKLDLRFRTAYAVTDRYSGDAEVGRQVAAAAADLARAYEQYRRKRRDDPKGFRYGPAAGPEAEAAVAAAEKGLQPTDTTEFPSFGKHDAGGQRRFSYSGFVLLPLKLGSGSYVAAVGHEGVGWREGGPTLIAVYAARPGKLEPLAGVVVAASNGGLRSAVVEDPVGPRKAR